MNVYSNVDSGLGHIQSSTISATRSFALVRSCLLVEEVEVWEKLSEMCQVSGVVR